MSSRNYIRVVEKKWGSEHWIANSPLYCAKLMAVLPGKAVRRHFHAVKFETFHLLQGSIQMEIGEEVFELKEGESVDIHSGIPHKFSNLSKSPAVILEISTQHLDSDSYPLEDYDENGNTVPRAS